LDHPSDPQFDLEALCSLDPSVRNPVITELHACMNGRMEAKVRQMMPWCRDDNTVRDLVEQCWERLLHRLKGRRPKHGIPGFLLKMQGYIVFEHLKGHARRATDGLSKVEKDAKGEPRSGWGTSPPSRIILAKELGTALGHALSRFREELEQRVHLPRARGKLDSPVLELAALDLYVSDGRDQAVLLERGLSPADASRLRKGSLDRLGAHLTAGLATVDSQVPEDLARLREELKPGGIFAEFWVSAGVACERHPPDVLANPHESHAEEVAWWRPVHKDRCPTCRAGLNDILLGPDEATDAVRRSLEP